MCACSSSSAVPSFFSALLQYRVSQSIFGHAAAHPERARLHPRLFPLADFFQPVVF